VSNRAPVKILAFAAASDLPKSSIEIASLEQSGMRKTPMVTGLSVISWKALSLDVKFLKALSSQIFTCATAHVRSISKPTSYVACFYKVSVSLYLPLKILVTM